MGRLKFAVRCREAGVRFSDGRTFGACVARVIASARRGIRRFWTDGNAGKHGCRERSTEAENALSLGLVEGSFALGSGAGSGSQTQRIGMLAGEWSEIFLKRFLFYTVKIVCSRFSGASRFRSLLVFPTRCRYCWAGVSASEMPIGDVRDFWGAFVVSASFRTIAMYRAHKTVSYGSRNDALSGCIVTSPLSFMCLN